MYKENLGGVQQCTPPERAAINQLANLQSYPRYFYPKQCISEKSGQETVKKQSTYQ